MRLTVALLALVVGGFFLVRLDSPLPAGLFLSFAILLVWNYFRHNSIWIAFRAFQAGDFAAVRWLLSSVRWPNLLSPTSKSYYHWLRGVVAAADDRLGAAQVHLLVAAAGKMRSANDRCLVQCLLAEIALQQEDRAGAREHLRLARALRPHSDVTRLLTALEARLER